MPPERGEGRRNVRPLEELSDAAPWHRDPGAVVRYTALRSLPGIIAPANVGAGTFHLDALAERYPSSALILGLYLSGQLHEVASGVLDHRIAQVKAEQRRYERPIYLRFGYEFDGPGTVTIQLHTSRLGGTSGHFCFTPVLRTPQRSGNPQSVRPHPITLTHHECNY